MNEIDRVLKKYDEEYIRQHFTDAASINTFALSFYKDAADIYDAVTRVRNIQRNPTGFDLKDAPILGLLVKIWKLLKEILKYYEQDNAELIAILERPLIEASVVATYLLRGDISVVEDYRKCSYRDRLRILRDLESGSAFLETNAGKRLLNSVREKMLNEGLTVEDFGEQKKNRWRVQGKSFYDVFALVERDELYACTYGMMSESIHGSWNESMDYSLSRNADGTYSVYPFFQPADVRFVSPTLRFANNPFRLWLERIEADDPSLVRALNWIDRVNTAIFRKFDETYDGQCSRSRGGPGEDV
ncbi:MAG: hypothetical protein HZB55_12675 [Deltaproteobacteria bacterium]|nr:hypothetical protein [Deltaproteobacteria bacterium]